MMMRNRRAIKAIRNKILPNRLRNREKTDKRRKRRSVTRRRRIRRSLLTDQRSVARLPRPRSKKWQLVAPNPKKQSMRNLHSWTTLLSRIRRSLKTRASATSTGPSLSLKWIASTLTIRRSWSHCSKSRLRRSELWDWMKRKRRRGRIVGPMNWLSSMKGLQRKWREESRWLRNYKIKHVLEQAAKSIFWYSLIPPGPRSRKYWAWSKWG